ncbi:MAG: hypothetical protein ACRD0P_12715 [Stackebrandtia sp.]
MDGDHKWSVLSLILAPLAALAGLFCLVTGVVQQFAANNYEPFPIEFGEQGEPCHAGAYAYLDVDSGLLLDCRTVAALPSNDSTISVGEFSSADTSTVLSFVAERAADGNLDPADQEEIQNEVNRIGTELPRSQWPRQPPDRSGIWGTGRVLLGAGLLLAGGWGYYRLRQLE